MRQASIPKNIVEALNSLFDENPKAVASLLEHRVPTDATVIKESEVGVGCATTQAYPADQTISVFDLLNVALGSVTDGLRLSKVYGADGMEGVVIGLSRKPRPDPVPSTTV